MKLTKKRIYEVLEVAKDGDLAGKTFNIFILTLIFLNMIAIILETVKPIYESAPLFFKWFEFFSVMVFSVEYCFRLWTCTESPEYTNPIKGRIRFALTPFAVIDLLAILPFYLSLMVVDLRFMRIVRLFRVFRIVKLVRYPSALQTFGRVLAAKKEELLIILSLMFATLLISSTLMYFAEKDTQPELFSSIPEAMWWGVVTLTTLGYGDLYPVTALGKFIGALIAIMGIGMFALPTAILGSAFLEEIQNRTSNSKVCPHCGKKFHA